MSASKGRYGAKRHVPGGTAAAAVALDAVAVAGGSDNDSEAGGSEGSGLPDDVLDQVCGTGGLEGRGPGGEGERLGGRMQPLGARGGLTECAPPPLPLSPAALQIERESSEDDPEAELRQLEAEATPLDPMQVRMRGASGRAARG